MKVGIYTLGCKVNTYESEYVTKCLMDNNCEIASFDDLCDVYIINTCTVTNTSDIKSRKIIRQAKRRNPDSCVIAMGCYVQKKEELIPEIDIAIGNRKISLSPMSYVRIFYKDSIEIFNLKEQEYLYIELNDSNQVLAESKTGYSINIGTNVMTVDDMPRILFSNIEAIGVLENE